MKVEEIRIVDYLNKVKLKISGDVLVILNFDSNNYLESYYIGELHIPQRIVEYSKELLEKVKYERYEKVFKVLEEIENYMNREKEIVLKGNKELNEFLKGVK